MEHTFRGVGLVASLAFFSLFAAVSDAKAQTTPSTAARVYIQIDGPEGAVYGYSATSAGELSSIAGSPFKLGTHIIAATSTKFLTLGETLLHGYTVGSNGAIQAEIGQASIYDYAGGHCGDSSDSYYTQVNSAELDHSGSYVYVLLQNGVDNCAAYQTYKIGSDGAFTFVGDFEIEGINVEPVSGFVGLPSILGTETFGYGEETSGQLSSVIGFRRESNGELEPLQFNDVRTLECLIALNPGQPPLRIGQRVRVLIGR